jgi:DNA polymerase III sliding clamp (beta) subunit (PCNA family)
MNFTVDVKEFSSTLNLIQSIGASGGPQTCCAIKLTKGNLWAYASNESITLKCKLKGVTDTEGSGTAGLDLTMLNRALKGRDKITFKNDENVFKFKAVKGNYNGEVAIIPITKETIESYEESLAKGKKAKVASLDPTAFNALRTSLAYTNISVIHASDILNTFIKLEDGILEVVGSDNFHLAYSKILCKTKAAFEISPTKTIFDTLGKLSDFYGGTTEVDFASENIKGFNEDYCVCSPTLQSSDTAFQRVKQYIQEMPKAMCTLTLGIGSTISALDNILSIYEDGALITLEFKNVKKKDVLEFSMKTSMGVISDSLVIETFKGKPFKCTFDPRMLLDSLNLSKSKEAKLQYIEDKALVLNCIKDETSITYVNSVVKE